MREQLAGLKDLGFDRDVSAYVVDGIRWASVTECIALAGLSDFSFVAPDVLEAAANRGKIVHGITAMMDRGETPWAIPDECAPYVRAYQRFLLDSKFEPLLIEHVVRNERQRYCGTLDRLGHLNGHLALIDLKCAVVVPKWAALQTAAYAAALPEPYAGQPVRRFALRLKPDETYSLHPFRDHSDVADFYAVARVAMYRMRTENLAL